MRKILLGISILTLVAFAGMVSAHTEDDPFVTDLIAGQHINVGEVRVWNDADNLYVEYETSDGWELVETHLYVGKTNPEQLSSAPGQFPYSDDNPYVIPLADIDSYSLELNKKGNPTGKWVANGDPGVEPCNNIHIAAHAVVQKTTVITPTPYYASAVVSYNQGLRKDGTPVRWQRSDPNQGLAFEAGQSEFNFFSLGFGGWIVVEFDCPIQNGEGNDIKVIEDTWGSYPLEKADVFASQDGSLWTWLGEADNTTRDIAGIHSISEFDLGSLEWGKYIKIVDTTDPAVHNNAADGYDLNAIEALHDCVEVQEETAWGDEGAIPFGTNWAMYFTYHVQEGTYTERYPETGNVYIGYEDWYDGDFDYNDFGMTFSVEEIYEVASPDDTLTELTMTFTAVIYDSGADHYIHIRRPLNGSYAYTVTRSTSAYAGETPAGAYAGSGELDLVLFNTQKYSWPQKNINETVTIHVVLNDPASNPKSTPTAPRWDVDPIMANYDPWEDPYYPGWISGAEFHIDDTQVISSTANQKYTPEIIPNGTELPFILVVPYTDWIPPYEDTTITGPYQYFDNYYISGGMSYPDWYLPVNVRPGRNVVGYGGLSWGPY